MKIVGVGMDGGPGSGPQPGGAKKPQKQEFNKATYNEAGRENSERNREQARKEYNFSRTPEGKRAQMSTGRKMLSPLIRGGATVGSALAHGVGRGLQGAGYGAILPGGLGTFISGGLLNAAGAAGGALVGTGAGLYEGAKKGWNWAKKRGDSEPAELKGRWGGRGSDKAGARDATYSPEQLDQLIELIEKDLATPGIYADRNDRQKDLVELTKLKRQRDAMKG